MNLPPPAVDTRIFVQPEAFRGLQGLLGRGGGVGGPKDFLTSQAAPRNKKFDCGGVCVCVCWGRREGLDS